MEELGKSRWEGNEHWFKFGHQAGLKRFDEISTLGSTATAVALRSVKYQLENELGFEVSDDLFCEIFRKVCNFRPVPALGCYAPLEFIQPLQRILEKHGVSGNHVGAIWRTLRVRVDNPRCYKNILIHVPHSSSSFPEGSRYSWNDLDDEERLLIDYYTDELFVPQQESDQISNLIFPYCRLYCDVERLINDPLEKNGLGISYSRWVSKDKYSKELRSFSSLSSVFRLYSEFHTEASLQILKSNGFTLIIDCHSFSNQATLLCSNPPDIDICIGYNDDETCPNHVVIGNIAQHFKSKGYKVGINAPFSNSKTFFVPKQYHSVMIEVNKRLYMDEQTYMRYDSFFKLKHDIQSLYKVLLKG
jgi:N-formylglutamate amidohydrolase